jgi:RNA polymerase sigma-70 factor, ECF subfamily
MATPSAQTPRPIPLDGSGPDAQVVARVRAGDEGGFGRLFTELYEPLWRFAFGCVRSSEAAEEIVQAVFLRVWEQRETWDAPAGVRAYFYSAVRNRALNYHRHERVVSEAAQGAAASPGEGFGQGVAPAAPDAAAESADLRRVLGEAVARLPERRRVALSLRWQHDMSYDEIAASMQTTAKAAAMLVARAMDALREALAGKV